MVIPIVILAGVGLVMATLLAVGRKIFAVEVDEQEERILNILPNANCGGCGFAGCSAFASALAKGVAEPTDCPPGGSELAAEIGKILGIEVKTREPLVAVVRCAGDNTASPPVVTYLGIPECQAAHNTSGGFKSCTFGCLGLGSCLDACPFNAIKITANGLAFVDDSLCTGCKKCVSACPRDIITIVPKSLDVHVLCHNPQKAKAVKAVCAVGCTGCKLCSKQSKQFKIDGALAQVNFDKNEIIPSHAPLACGPGVIFDRREYALKKWLTDSETRKHFKERAATWKKAEKEKKAKAKEAKKKMAESKKNIPAKLHGNQNGGLA